MDIIPEDKHFKNYDQRVLNTQALSSVKSINIILMIFLSFITFGIYNAFWYYKKIKELNLLYPSYTFNRIFVAAFFIIFSIHLGLSVIDLLVEHTIPELVINVISRVVVFMMIFLAFMSRNRFNAIVGAKPGDEEWFSGWWTFFFNLFYIQHKVNKIKSNEKLLKEQELPIQV